jgi:hypothetical protein
MKETEVRLRLQTEKAELESRVAVLVKDNKTLESSLKDLSKIGSSGVSSNEIDMSLKILILEKERDLLKWNQER